MDYSIMRLMKLAREFQGDSLLDEALSSEPKTVDAISQLYVHGVVEQFGRDTQSEVGRKYWQACGTFLVNAGFTREQLQKIRRPYPVHGEPGFRSILDEMRDEGWDI